MDKETVLAEKVTTLNAKTGVKPKINPARTRRSSQIREAVARSVREYGETLKKLAKEG